MDTVKKIDVHAHIRMWPNRPMSVGCILPVAEELKESYRELNVDKGLILSIISPECQFSIQPNEEMEHIAKSNPDSFYWCCNFDPRMGKNSETTDFSYFLNYYKERGAVGVGELTANLYVDDPLMDNFFYHCGECDMPVIIHLTPKNGGDYGIIDEMGLYRIEKMLKKHPKLKIVGHSQYFWRDISENVATEKSVYASGKVNGGRVAELLRNYPNLFCDLSAGSGFNALNRDPDHAYRFIEEFSDRLMYGTDICRAKQETKLAAWLDESYANGMITRENYVKICRGNAIKVFNLKNEKAE